MTKRSWMWVIAGAVLALPMGGAAQGPMGEQGMRAWHEEQLTDFEAMRDKFLALAEAFPEDTWDWTPMDDVRSVRDVMALIVAGGLPLSRALGRGGAGGCRGGVRSGDGAGWGDVAS